MKTDFPTASVGSSQAPTAAVEKSQSASNTEIRILPLTLTDRADNTVTMTSIEFGGSTDFSTYFPSVAITVTP